MSFESKPPFFADKPFANPTDISELAQNAISELFNQAQAGLIPWSEAKVEMDALETVRSEVGDDWFDRYGPRDPEFDCLFEDD